MTVVFAVRIIKLSQRKVVVAVGIMTLNQMNVVLQWG